MSDQPELKPGQKVAIYINHYGEATAETVTITRETNTQLITGGPGTPDRARRFRKADHREIGDRGAWSPTPHLLPLDDPAVVRAQRVQADNQIFSRTIGAIRAWEQDKNNVEAIDTAITALTNYRHYTHGASR
ncbi:hypothetical protein [Paeniglutamicibacter terrestris]|uniref:Uncharacterized protein n=1 Tax=Paeniglutamicibacter terrestris TaxID=2723403 RepID=A0ABX1G4B3_9MICC|nr:hypothetical protein [Paeniglutamicibacter terrestris]NKG21087.1 hypothetical protein [Paeniglutamicibacter terrestris]